MAGRKPPRTASLLRAPAPPPAAEDPREVERFIRGEAPPGAPHDAAQRSTTPHDAPRRSGASGPGSRDGSRAFQRWRDGSEARKHTVYLPVLVSEDLLRACKDNGKKVSRAFEEAVVAWLDARGSRR